MEESMLKRATIVPLMDKMIQQMIEMESNITEDTPVSIIDMNKWDWSQGVALFSLYLYYKQSKEERILHYLVNWFDQRIAEGLPAKNINTMCPLLTLSYLYEETNRSDFYAICTEWVQYAMSDLPRTTEMGLAHATIDGPNEQQLWDDTLYMTVLFIGRMGTLASNEHYYQESIRQFLVHLKYLTDVKTGLFFHGFTFDGNHHFAEALWGRGNAWYTAGLVDYLDIVSLDTGVKQFLLTSLERQIAALTSLQADNGSWHTILNDPTSYQESSATSGFAYGILKAVRLGYIDKSYQIVGMKAANAVLAQTDEAGIVHRVSYGTRMGETIDYYKQIPQTPMPYGQSMALLMLVECLQHLPLE